MDFLSRRTIRKYKEEKVSKEVIEKILKNALVSPSGRNKKPYEFLVVEDKATLLALSTMKAAGANSIATCSFAVVVIGMEEVSDTWVEDTSIASTILQLAAWNEKVGSCWVQMKGRSDKDGNPSEVLIKKHLNIPESLRVLNILSFGYINEERNGYTESDMDFTKIHWEKY